MCGQSSYLEGVGVCLNPKLNNAVDPRLKVHFRNLLPNSNCSSTCVGSDQVWDVIIKGAPTQEGEDLLEGNLLVCAWKLISHSHWTDTEVLCPLYCISHVRIAICVHK